MVMVETVKTLHAVVDEKKKIHFFVKEGKEIKKKDVTYLKL